MLISLGCTELLFGPVAHLWLNVSPRQKTNSALNKTEVRDCTADCVGITSNASRGFYDLHGISKASSDSLTRCAIAGAIKCEEKVKKKPWHVAGR